MKSALETYIEVAVYALFVVYGFDAIMSGAANQVMFGVMMIGVSIARIVWLNYRWKRRGETNDA